MIQNACKIWPTRRSFITSLLILMLIAARADQTTFGANASLSELVDAVGLSSSITEIEKPITSSSISPLSLPLAQPWQQSIQSSSAMQTLSPTTAFKFQNRIYNVSIRENSVGKVYALQSPHESKMGIASSNDVDIKYRIIGGDKDKLFKAEERTIGDFTFLTIRTRTGNIVLNREKTDSYRLKIRATGTKRGYKTKIIKEDECDVIVHVLDTNDLSPLFYPNEYSTTVPEDMPLHQSIIKVTAEDADLGINGEIYYSFLNDNDWFSVHPTTGVITLTRPLKFIEKSLHELIVIATDRGGSQINRLSQPSKAKVKIRVRQVI